jgi:hypothetical protein
VNKVLVIDGQRSSGCAGAATVNKDHASINTVLQICQVRIDQEVEAIIRNSLGRKERGYCRIADRRQTLG